VNADEIRVVLRGGSYDGVKLYAQPHAKEIVELEYVPGINSYLQLHYVITDEWTETGWRIARLAVEVIDVRIDHDDMCSVATQRHNATPGVGG
jgi:hypothetical protein